MRNGKIINLNKVFLSALLLLLITSCEENAFYEKNFLNGSQVTEDSEGQINDDLLDKIPKDESQSTSEEDSDENITEDNTDISENETIDNQENTIDEVEAPDIIINEETFSQKSSENKKIDILWVIDNSGSMEDEQNSLAFNFESFISEFIQKDVDFQMAVTTTDASWSHDGELIGNLTNLTSIQAAKDINAFQNSFKETVKVGINGSGYEKGLRTSKSFLEKHKTGWLREDAMLAVVYLSDEEDQSANEVSNYLTYLKSLKVNEGMIKLYSIVNIEKTGLPYYETIGTRYMEASKETGGFHSNIKNDFHETLQAMGDKIVTLLDSFPLSKTPKNIDSLQVFINEEESVDWTYDEASKSIKFNENSVPGEGAVIKIKYEI